jgi:glycerophosphoryl diester phosphodiesterase
VSRGPWSGLALVVAHRGSSATHAENTLEAFDAAVTASADAVEFDVRLTADGHPVVLHDATVDRTTNGTGPVRAMTLDEVARLHVGDGSSIPTLVQTLRLLSGRVGIDIEIKNIPGEPDFDADRERVVEATLHALHATGFVGPVLVSSFNPLSIAKVREAEPGLATGLLTTADVEAEAAMSFALAQGHGWVLPSAERLVGAGESLASHAHGVGMRLGTWIVDDPAVGIELMRAGLDAVATNDPSPLVRARHEAAENDAAG